MVDSSIPFISMTRSSAYPVAFTPSHSFSSLSSSSNGTFQQRGESTPPYGVPKCNFLLTFEPSSSDLTTLLVTEDSYHATKYSVKPLFLIAFNAFSVLRLLKAPAMSPHE